MNQRTPIPASPASLASAIKPVLIGAGVALLLILLFLSGVDNPDPQWGKFWMIKPLVIVPLSGAMGGAFFHFMGMMSGRGLNKTVSILLGIIIYTIGLWLGSVLGLNGTLWN